MSPDAGQHQTPAAWPAVAFLASMATLVRSYLTVKLFFLALFLLAFIFTLALKKAEVVVYLRLVWFYVWIGFAGLMWAIIGLLHPDNYVQGVFDALRLYVVWSAAFVVIYTILRAGPSLKSMHTAMVVAGILIPFVNLVALYDQISGSGLLSENIRQELMLEIGFGNGYFQFNSVNISAMFLVAPYLLSLQFRTDAGNSNSALTKLSLVLSLSLVVLSGRRALWIVVALTPLTILLLSSFVGTHDMLKTGGKRVLIAFAAAGIVGLGAILIRTESGSDIGSINRLMQAFSSEDERTIQRPYLIDGFLEAPLFGSGFGGYAGYQRNELKPWTYELTYQTLLFNMGIVGTACLVALFSWYLASVLRLLRRFKDGSAVPFALLVAFFSLLGGAYSNPYFAGFDTLFFAGLLPFLATFQQGFDQTTPTARVSR